MRDTAGLCSLEFKCLKIASNGEPDLARFAQLRLLDRQRYFKCIQRKREHREVSERRHQFDHALHAEMI